MKLNMKKLKINIGSIFVLSISLLLLGNIKPVVASDVGFNLAITPTETPDQFYHGTCCQDDDLSTPSNFPMYQQFTPTAINSITKVKLEFNAVVSETYTIHITDDNGTRLGSATTSIIAPGWIEFNFSPAIEITQETIYRIELTQSTGSLLFAFNDPADYSRGFATTGGANISSKDYHFEVLGTFVQAPGQPADEEDDQPSFIEIIIDQLTDANEEDSETLTELPTTTEEFEEVIEDIQEQAGFSLFLVCGITFLIPALFIVFLTLKDRREKKKKGEDVDISKF